MNKRNLTIWLLLPAMLLGLLTACKTKAEQQPEPLTLPEQYVVDEAEVAALLPGGEAISCQEEQPGLYRYEGLVDAGQAVADYATAMTAADGGFLIVNDTFAQTNVPNFGLEEGTVLLAKPAAEGMLVSVRLDWGTEQCMVQVQMQEGTVRQGGGSSAGAGMTLIECVDHFYSLDPARLDLGGESMREYQIYARDGISFVDGRACVRICVYSRNNQAQTNQFQNEYLMTTDGQHIYHLNSDSGLVSEFK